MPPPSVRINTLVNESSPKLDRISKMFILCELAVGINRLAVFGKVKLIYALFAFCHATIINFIVIYITYLNSFDTHFDHFRVLKLCQYCVCVILSLLFRKKLCKFFEELDSFDKETGFRRVNIYSVQNTVQIIFTLVFIVGFIITFYFLSGFESYGVDITLILVIHVSEFHFYAHLLSLLIPRLRLIGDLIKMSFANSSDVTIIENQLVSAKEKRKTPADMKTLMNFYHKIIIAYDILYEAIKWQMLTIIVISFITSLSISYRVTLQYIRHDYVIEQILVNMTIAAFEMIPMFAPCRTVDTVRCEVSRLAELLSSKVYENKLEKSSRPVAQALLALMEARDLSFTLLRIFDIDISFPFKFMGLLLTYLIILLQFEKVINLDRSPI